MQMDHVEVLFLEYKAQLKDYQGYTSWYSANYEHNRR